MTFITSLLVALISILVYLSSGMVRQSNRLAVQAITVLIGAVALIAAMLKTLTVVPAGNVGVTEILGRVDDRPLPPGVHLLNPFAEVKIFSTRVKDMNEDVEAISQEGLSFHLHVSLQYEVDPTKAALIYQTIGSDETEIVRSRFRSVVREITTSYPAEAVYSSKRQEVSSRLQASLTKQLVPLGFTVEGVFLRGLVLPEQLNAAIQEKLKAEQESQEMRFTLQRERQEADRKRVEAQGIADAQTIVARSLTRETLQLRAIEATEKLAASNNAKVLIMGGSQGGLPMILQLDSNSLSPKPVAPQP